VQVVVVEMDPDTLRSLLSDFLRTIGNILHCTVDVEMDATGSPKIEPVYDQVCHVLDK